MAASTLVTRYADRLGLENSENELQRRVQRTTDEVINLIDELLVAHVRSICFESLDVIALRAAGESRGFPTDLDSLTTKLLEAGRGGGCHEHAACRRCRGPHPD